MKKSINYVKWMISKHFNKNKKMNWYFGFGWPPAIREKLLKEQGAINITSVYLSSMERCIINEGREDNDGLLNDVLFQADEQTILFLKLRNDLDAALIPDFIVNAILTEGVIDVDAYPGLANILEQYTYGYFVA